MFTGMIESVGVFRSRRKGRGRTVTIEIAAPRLARSLRKGSSVSVNGACLTVVGNKAGRLLFHAVKETMRRTALGSLRPGDAVNLERALKAGRRFEGHFVLGHIDGVGRVLKVLPRGQERSVLVGYPKALRKFFVEKGSVAVDGVSLTLGRVEKKGFWVHLIPHSLRATRMKAYAPGSLVNLEADILAKLVRRASSGR